MESDLSPLWISLQTATAATALAFVLGIGAAAVMHRYEGRARGVIDGLLTLPLVLPPTVVGFFLLLVFGRRSMLGQALEHLGMRIAFSWPATVIAATVVAFPLMYRATLGALEQVNPSLPDAARTLGAGEWRTFYRIQLPLARPGVIAGLVLTFARALGEFGATLMIAGNIPGRTQTMPIAIFFAAEAGDLRRALAWVVLISLLSLGAIAAINYRPRPIRSTDTSAPVEPAVEMHFAGAPVAAASSGTLEVSVRKCYPGFTLAARFSAQRGPLGLLGASGSGKSMTLRCIAGLTQPEEGRIVLNGRTLLDTERGVNLSPRERQVGVVFQDYALFPHLTVRGNIGFGLAGLDSQEQGLRIERWARAVRMDHLMDALPGDLSGGQRQRVALARALAVEPDALLLDEPFSALDPHLRRQMEEQMREALSRFAGVTVFVTHDREEAYRLCETLAVLAGGTIAGVGEKEALFRDPQSLAVARLTGCKNFSAIARAVDGRIRATGWECELAAAPEDAEYVGIRAHDLRVCSAAGGESYPCWLVSSVASPFETTLYLRLHSAPDGEDKVHLEAELSREEWAGLREAPQPWRVVIEPSRLLFLKR